MLLQTATLYCDPKSEGQSPKYWLSTVKDQAQTASLLHTDVWFKTNCTWASNHLQLTPLILGKAMCFADNINRILKLFFSKLRHTRCTLSTFHTPNILDFSMATHFNSTFQKVF